MTCKVVQPSRLWYYQGPWLYKAPGYTRPLVMQGPWLYKAPGYTRPLGECHELGSYPPYIVVILTAWAELVLMRS